MTDSSGKTPFRERKITCSTDIDTITCSNAHTDKIAQKYICVYTDNLLAKFRTYNKDHFTIKIYGIERFIDLNNSITAYLLDSFNRYDFDINICGGNTILERIKIECINETRAETFEFQIQDIPSLCSLSSETNIPPACLIVMRIVAQAILKYKVIYKAVILDLDDTLWYGTLSEDGPEKIEENLYSEIGKPYIVFMNFIKVLSDELGIFVAVCSRNNDEPVKQFIDHLDEDIFPLKNHIDCLIANYNDKSENLKKIADTFSILPQSMIFIDDNKIIADEIKQQLPDVFVPQWNNHNDLTAQLIAGCFFERNELSINSQKRRENLKVIQVELTKNRLPNLLIHVDKDACHAEAKRLYVKSNQFKFAQKSKDFNSRCESLCFKLFRECGAQLGVCSTLTLEKNDNALIIHNWAISCQFFKIGIEEFILLHLIETFDITNIRFVYQKTEFNNKVDELINKYRNAFVDKDGYIELNISHELIAILRKNTNLRLIQHG